MTATFLAALLLAVMACVPNAASAADPLPGFRGSAWFGEQVREEWVEPGVRVVVNAPGNPDPARPTRLVVYATPNGNTIEQTLGSALADGTDWHFDIQHVAAQVRRLREVTPGENVVLAVVEPDGLSWPAWRQKQADNAARIRALVDTLRKETPGSSVRVALTGHSGGGSFLFGFVNGGDAIPDWVERIAFLDANYSYSDDDRHGDKLLAWLKGDPSRRLTVIAYDDREITLDGKKVVGPTGGTYRASERMRARFSRDAPLSESKSGDFVNHAGMDGRVRFHVHANPRNRILHTALVGEMNGLLEALAAGAPRAGEWGVFGGPRAYGKWVQPAAGVPPRPADASGGRAFLESVADLPLAEREAAAEREIRRGNIPDFLRRFVPVTVRAKGTEGKERAATFEAMPDYLAVGSDADFVRVPLTPMTGQRIADAFGCALPTRKMVDDVYARATDRREPRPLTEAREAARTFLQHDAIIDGQGPPDKPLGAIVAGIKKDVVVTNRLAEKPNRVAIYGWHKPDGSPIQSLTIVHRDTYVDYSHGVRLVKRAVTVDGRVRDIRHVLFAADLHPLLSDEGPLLRPAY